MRISDWSSDVCSSDLEIFPGAELAASSWDILTGDAPVGGTVLLYDDNAAHPGLAAAETIAEAGATLEIVTPERFFAVDVGGLNHQAYARCFDRHGVRLTISKRVVAAERAGNRLQVTLGSDYSDRVRSEEHPSELQSLMRISYAVFCLK